MERVLPAIRTMHDLGVIHMDLNLGNIIADENNNYMDDGAHLAVEECTDRGDECDALAAKNECTNNPGYMKYQCAKTCGTCDEYTAAYASSREGKGNGPCTDKYKECKNWANMGECGYNPNFMLFQCERSCMRCFEDT